MLELAFSLPLPPSVNNCYADAPRQTVEGKRYTKRVASKRLKQYKQDAPFLMHQQGLIRDMWAEAGSVKYDLTVYFRYLPTQARPADLSNRLKAYEDVVSQYLGFDDALIDELHVKRDVDTQRPRIEGRWYRCS